jgi:hypothetical protein
MPPLLPSFCANEYDRKKELESSFDIAVTLTQSPLIFCSIKYTLHIHDLSQHPRRVYYHSFMSSFASASFLNVYSEKQGGKNLASLLSSVPFLLLTSLYFLCYGLLNLDAQGADTRDIFDDFRLTLPASSIMHWWGNATVNQVPPPEVSSAAFDAVPLKRNQRVVEGVGDPRSYFISGSQLAMFVPKTQNAHMSFSGNVRSRIGSSASAPATWSAATGWTVPSQLISVFVAVPTRNTSVTQSVRSQRFSRIVSRQTPSGVVSYAVADVEVALVALRTGACQCCLHLLRPSYTTIFRSKFCHRRVWCVSSSARALRRDGRSCVCVSNVNAGACARSQQVPAATAAKFSRQIAFHLCLFGHQRWSLFH